MCHGNSVIHALCTDSLLQEFSGNLLEKQLIALGQGTQTGFSFRRLIITAA
jgi:hypothetical protein